MIMYFGIGAKREARVFIVVKGSACYYRPLSIDIGDPIVGG